MNRQVFGYETRHATTTSYSHEETEKSPIGVLQTSILLNEIKDHQ